MNKIDRFIAKRVLTGIFGTVAVFLALISLSEALDTWRLHWLTETRGGLVAALSVFASASRWSIKALPVTVLIGAILSLISLQSSREMVVIKAGGLSIWQIMRGPILALLVIGFAISLIIDSEVTQLNRWIAPAPQQSGATVDDNVWIEQTVDGKRMIIEASQATADKRGLEEATFFLPSGSTYDRVRAAQARLNDHSWELRDVVLIASSQKPKHTATYTLPTDSMAVDLALKLSSTEDFTFFELARAMSVGIADPVTLAAAKTRFARLTSLPILIIGTLLIAFAFTGGYRKTGSYGSTIIYGIVLGFIVFVINEMADRAGSAGAIDPALAAWGPAILAVFIGLTVLLYKEDGRNVARPRRT